MSILATCTFGVQTLVGALTFPFAKLLSFCRYSSET